MPVYPLGGALPHALLLHYYYLSLLYPILMNNDTTTLHLGTSLGYQTILGAATNKYFQICKNWTSSVIEYWADFSRCRTIG